MSNKYLFNEEPKSFSPTIAEALDSISKAVIIQQIHFWIYVYSNKRDRQHFFDGHYWVFNSYNDWHRDLKFIKFATLKRQILELEKDELLISAEFNKNRGNRTKWYRINYERLAILTKGVELNRLVQNEPPSDHFEPPSDHFEPPSDHFEPPSDHFEPPSDQNRTLCQSDHQSDHQSDPHTNKAFSQDFSNQTLSDRIEKAKLLEQAKWTPAGIDCRTLAKDDEFAEYIRAIYLPTTAHYLGKQVEISAAKSWIIDGFYDPAKRLKVEIQLEAFETWRSRQQKAKAATQNENNAKPRLLKPNPITWTNEQKTWSYDQWEKYLHEQNTSNTSIYAPY